MNQKGEFRQLSTYNLVSGTTSDGIISTPEMLDGEFIIEYFSCTNLLYNVNSTNSLIQVTVGGLPHFVPYTQGNYSLADLATMLTSVMVNVGGSGVDVTVTDNQAQQTLTFTPSSGNITISFLNSSPNANKLLGFDFGTTDTDTSLTSTYACDLFPYKNIYLRLEEISGYHILGTNYFSTSLFLPFDNTFGQPYIYKRHIETEQKITVKTTNTIQFRFHDEYDNAVDLNNAEWQLILRQVKGQAPETKYIRQKHDL